MRSDFLHVQSYRFEGLGDFLFFCCAQHVLSPRRRRGGKKRFISCCASGVSFYTLIHHKIIQHKVPIVRALGLVETHLPPAVPARFTSPITHLNRKYSNMLAGTVHKIEFSDCQAVQINEANQDVGLD